MVMAVVDMRQHLCGSIREDMFRVKAVFSMQRIHILHAGLEASVMP